VFFRERAFLLSLCPCRTANPRFANSNTYQHVHTSTQIKDQFFLFKFVGAPQLSNSEQTATPCIHLGTQELNTSTSIPQHSQHIRTGTHHHQHSHINTNTSAHHHLHTSLNQHINTSTHQHITHQHINTSTHQQINASTYQHTNTSTQHINTSAHQQINTVINTSHINTSIQSYSLHAHTKSHPRHPTI
jgi:hypothetical protein